MPPARLGSLVALFALGIASGCSDPTPPPRWFYTCGDPVCSSYRPPVGVRACVASEVAGEMCAPENDSCDPRDECNRLLACAVTDPTRGAGGCPISRASAKRDIHYLDPAEIDRLYAELRSLRLAAYRYRDAGPGPADRLGFIIDDGPPAACVNGGGDRVDLYGYTSLAVAAVQAQAKRIEVLERELAELRTRLDNKTVGSRRAERPAPSRSDSGVTRPPMTRTGPTAPDSSR